MKIPRVVVLTGAGISAASGIPTFREAQTGLWSQYNPQELATPQAFARNPRLVWEFYDWRRQLMEESQPNPAHITLAQMETVLPEFTLVTQNIDGLHALAGSRRVIYLHGDIWHIRCTQCTYAEENRQVPLVPLPPKCPRCGAIMRPDVVWFGEALDSMNLSHAQQAFTRAHLALVVGTSANVYPAAQLPLLTVQNGGKLIEFNTERTALSSFAQEVVLGPSETTLPQWWQAWSRTLNLPQA
ncbi:MAG: NAD-dependent deacylase [Chloroflexi bacterium]|nr:NAD-dependent deacylase [Chloroflexota bacterium]